MALATVGAVFTLWPQTSSAMELLSEVAPVQVLVFKSLHRPVFSMLQPVAAPES